MLSVLPPVYIPKSFRSNLLGTGMEISDEDLRMAEAARVEKEKHERELMEAIPLDTKVKDELVSRTTMILAASVYLATNDLWEVSRQVALPRYQIERWTQEDWWPQAMELARFKQGERLDTNLSKVIDRTMEAINDRLEVGDVKVLADGTVVRVPAKLKDLRDLMQMAIDKRKVVRDSQKSGTMSDDEMLDRLADRLTKMGSIKSSIESSARRVDGHHHSREAGENVLVPDVHEGAAN